MQLPVKSKLMFLNIDKNKPGFGRFSALHGKIGSNFHDKMSLKLTSNIFQSKLSIKLKNVPLISSFSRNINILLNLCFAFILKPKKQ